MKKIHTFGILLLMMMLVSCVTAGAGFTNEQLSGIHRGMTLNRLRRYSERLLTGVLMIKAKSGNSV